MTALRKHNLGFLLTEGVTLEAWDKAGILTREMEPYNILAEHFNKIYIFTHGGETETKYEKHFKPNIEIIFNPTKFKGGLYSFLLPFIHGKTVKRCRFFKTNQMLGSQALITIKLFVNRKAKIISRVGHHLSFVKKRKKRKWEYLKALLLEFAVYRLCDKALVTSREMKDAIARNYKIKRDKITVIANYINTDTFSPDPEAKKRVNRIIYVGRVIPQKNLPLLAEALAGTGIALDIIGSGGSAERLKKTADDLGVEVNFLAPMTANEKIPTILNEYEIFVLPSKWEGMPKALLEAMSCALACVGVNTSGTKEVIRHGENGLLAEANADSLRKNILKLAENEKLRRKLGNAARKFVLDNYSLSREIKKEIKIYNNLIA